MKKNGYSEVTWGQCLGGNVFTLSTYDHPMSIGCFLFPIDSATNLRYIPNDML